MRFVIDQDAAENGEPCVRRIVGTSTTRVDLDGVRFAKTLRALRSLGVGTPAHPMIAVEILREVLEMWAEDAAGKSPKLLEEFRAMISTVFDP